MIKRTIEEVVRKSLRTFPVTALVGARQVGKSTLSDYIGKGLGFTYVSLDDLTLRAEANADPRFFLSRFPAPLVIDEAQKVAPLFDEIARIVILIPVVVLAGMIVRETREEKNLHVFALSCAQQAVNGLPDHVFIQR